jgi:hypothetical protein
MASPCGRMPVPGAVAGRDVVGLARAPPGVDALVVTGQTANGVRDLLLVAALGRLDHRRQRAEIVAVIVEHRRQRRLGLGRQADPRLVADLLADAALRLVHPPLQVALGILAADLVARLDFGNRPVRLGDRVGAIADAMVVHVPIGFVLEPLEVPDHRHRVVAVRRRLARSRSCRPRRGRSPARPGRGNGRPPSRSARPIRPCSAPPSPARAGGP